MKYSCEVLDPVLIYIEGVHRLATTWNYSEYLVAAQIFHGTRPFGNPVLSRIAQPCVSFQKRLVFDCWSVARCFDRWREEKAFRKNDIFGYFANVG